MKILALDTSICSMGYAVIVANKGINFIEKPEIKSYGIISTDSNDTMDKRLFEIYTDVSQIIAEESPDVMVCESQYMIASYMTNAVLKTSEVKGLLRGCAYAHKLYMEEINPKAVKSFLGIPARMKRKECKDISIQYANSFPTVQTKSDDVADAIAIGLTYLLKI